MKKIIKKICSLFSSIINNFLVLPISKLILFFNNKFKLPSKRIENWLSKTNTLLFISLIIAIVMFVAIDQKMLSYSENSAFVLTDQKVDVKYDEDNYVIEGIPESVDITLIGNTVDLFIAKQSPTNDVSIDLKGLKPGTHKVDIKYNQIDNGLKYNVNPSVATVLIYEKVSATKTLFVDLLNQDSLDSKYIIDKKNVDLDSVTVKGASYKVDRVATVKALVDVKNLPKFKLGEAFSISAPLIAYDDNGNVVDVEISPSKVDVELTVSSPSKTVPIQVIPEGNVVYNKGISSLIVNNNSNTNVTIFGPSEVLASIDYIPVSIDVKNLAEDTQFKVKLEKPVGIKHMSINNITVDVKLSGDIKNKEINNVGISWINLASDYGVTPVDIDSVSVKLKGVSAIVDNIKPEDLSVYVDLKGLPVGIHDVPIVVKGNDKKVEYKASILKMKVKIYQK